MTAGGATVTSTGALHALLFFLFFSPPPPPPSRLLYGLWSLSCCAGHRDAGCVLWLTHGHLHHTAGGVVGAKAGMNVTADGVSTSSSSTTGSAATFRASHATYTGGIVADMRAYTSPGSTFNFLTVSDGTAVCG